MAARGAVTQLGGTLTRLAGLVAGHGIKDNLEEAYMWLSQRYQKGDQIFVTGPLRRTPRSARTTNSAEQR
jgi:uncharacterized protein (DUF2235 family)